MTIIADRGLFIRILTASGKVGVSEAEAYADALDGASKDPATKADIAELRAEIALLTQRIEGQGKRFDERMDERFRRVEERMDERFRRVDDRFDALTNKLLVRIGGVVIAVAGVLFAALRLSPH